MHYFAPKKRPTYLAPRYHFLIAPWDVLDVHPSPDLSPENVESMSFEGGHRAPAITVGPVLDSR
jgi:hypothetical protein